MVIAISSGLFQQPQYLPVIYNTSDGAGGVVNENVFGVLKIQKRSVTLQTQIIGGIQIPIGTGLNQVLVDTIRVAGNIATGTPTTGGTGGGTGGGDTGGGTGGGTGGETGGGGTVTPAPVTADLNVNFETVGALPDDWTGARNVAVVSGNGLAVNAPSGEGSSGFFYTVKSPSIVPRDGLTLEMEFRSSYEFGAAGFVATSGEWGSYAKPDSFVVTSANSSGELHDGQQFIQKPSQLATAPGYNKLRLEFGSSTVRVLLSAETSPGVFASRYDESRPIPQDMYNGVQAIVSPFSGEMVLRTLSSTQSGSTGGGTGGNTGGENVSSKAGFQRTVPAGFFGYNGSGLDIGDNDRGYPDYNSVNMAFYGQSIAKVGGNVIRLPGGDEANFWNENGLYQNTEQTVPLWEFHFHGLALPIWIAYQTGEQTASPNNFKRMFDAAGTGILVWVANVTTSTPALEVAKIQNLIALGFPLTHIELGNEIFFGLPYYMGDGDPNSPKYLRGHTSADAYMIDMRDNFIPAFRNAFGSAYDIGIPIVPKNPGFGPRENGWSESAINTGCAALCDFFAVHPYYDINDIGLRKVDVGNESRAGVIAKAAYRAMQSVLRNPALSIFGENAEILVTEFNVLEDQSQTGVVALGQSWLHSLIQCLNIAIMLRDKRITMALVHSLLGNAQWSGLVGQDGTNIDANKRGIDDNPFTAGLSTPLTPTLSGFTMGLFQRLCLKDGGFGTLIVDDEAFMAWRIEGSAKDSICVINSTNETKTFPVPTDKSWDWQRWQNQAWYSTYNTDSVPAPALGTSAAGSSLSIPKFSLVILAGEGSAPADATPPTLTVTGHNYRQS